MPTPSEADLHARAMANVGGGNSAQFGPLALLVLSAILSACISHLVAKCLNNLDPVTVRSPGLFRRWQLRRLVNSKCGDADVLAKAGLDAKAIDRAYGDVVAEALLKTGASLTSPEAIELTKGAHADCILE